MFEKRKIRLRPKPPEQQHYESVELWDDQWAVKFPDGHAEVMSGEKYRSMFLTNEWPKP